jgi:hypothetical protein
MLPIRIIPRYRLLVRYDIRPEVHDAYYQYIVREFVPALQTMGLYMVGVWHTAYGTCPARQLDFVSDSLEAVREIVQSERWEELEARLRVYTLRYDRKVVRYQNRFQF